MLEANERDDAASMRILAYGLMPNHLHLVLWLRGEGNVGSPADWASNRHIAPEVVRW